jgi:hypothetical protein
MSASASSIAMNNCLASTTALKQSVFIGIAEYLSGYTEFAIGTDEQDETAKKHGVQAMNNGLSDVVSVLGGREIDQARVDEQQKRISALVVHFLVTGVYRKAFTKVRNVGSRVWNRVFGRRAEPALGE